MSTENPFEGDVSGSGDDAPYEWLDEWLCEYVDGTMDPSIEAVFEQYVEANPELKAHVERLQETRELLCNCGLSEEPSTEVQAEICSEVECDMLRSAPPMSEQLSNRPIAVVGIASFVVAALVIGFLAGMMVVEPASSVSAATSNTTIERVASDAPPVPPQRSRDGRDEDDLQFLRRSAVPFSASDTAQSTSRITTIGAP